MRTRFTPTVLAIFAGAALLPGCSSDSSSRSDRFEAFKLRPQVEDAYGYTHAIRVGDRIMISGAVSMDEEGTPIAVGDLSQQMRNCYADLDRVLKHYGCTFDDVVVENIFTTDMAGFLQLAGYRSEIYRSRFPTGSWLEVKGLALPEFMIEIELEVHAMGRSDEEWPATLDALVAAPEHHRLLFENEQVRVLETVIQPGEVAPVHTHRWPAVYYMLAVGEHVRRDAQGAVTFDSREVAQKPKVGEAVWAPPIGPHSLENVGVTVIRVDSTEIKGPS